MVPIPGLLLSPSVPTPRDVPCGGPICPPPAETGPNAGTCGAV